jgi:ATP-binding cassette ChvD family protein
MSSYQYIFTLKELTKTFSNGKKCFENITLSFLPGVKIGLVGVNGAGKSTLLKIMAGIEKEFNGEAYPAQGVKVGYLPQEPKLDESKTVRENILESVSVKKSLLDQFNNIATSLADDYSDEKMEEMTKLQDKIDSMQIWDIDSKIDMAMEALRCPDDSAVVSTLSGGEIRRVALCKLLLEEPDLLLLDEPTNHLDAETVSWLQQHLIAYKGTILIVTHDRYFLDQITGWILELDRGKGLPFEGNYSDWLENKSTRLELEEKTEKSKNTILKKELDWIRQGAKARQAKQKARITAYLDLLNEDKKEKISTSQIIIPNGQRLGTKVIDAEKITKTFDNKMLFEDFSFSIPPGAIVGVVGANGAGKSTLLKILTGDESLTSGQISMGDTVELSYVDQSRDKLDDAKNVWEEISDSLDVIKLGDLEVNSRAYVGAFNFKGPDQQKRVGQLSGGERNRVHLAKLLKSGGNVLLLDEPTNDLDIETLRALEDAVLEFAGCVIVVSHDRFFMDRLCTHILSFEGESNMTFFEGNFNDYEEDKKRRLGEAAVIPQRVKYRKFST